MHLKKPAFTLLFCCGFSACTVGCTAVDAIVGSPAGNFSSGPSHRFAAIANILRDKGRDTEVKLTYQEALKAEPESLTGRDHLKYLATVGRAPEPNADERNSIVIAEAGIRPDGPKESSREKPVLTLSDPPQPEVKSHVSSVHAFETDMLAESVSPPRSRILEESVAAFPQHKETPPTALAHPDWDDELSVEPKPFAVRFVSYTSENADRETAQNLLHLRNSESNPRSEQVDLTGPASLERNLFADETAQDVQSPWRPAQRRIY